MEGKTVCVGSEVTLKYDGDPGPIAVVLRKGQRPVGVGPEWVSLDAPLGRALLGRTAGESVRVVNPTSGTTQGVTIISVK